MWTWLKRTFGKQATDEIDSIRPVIEAILAAQIDTDDQRASIDESLVDALERLEAEIVRIKEAAAGYPGNSGLPEDDWIAGVACADSACALYEHLIAVEWIERAENASALWAQAVLAVCSHHHHMVGPAMIANAGCHERLGNPARAIAMYRAVLGDFGMLLNGTNLGDTLDDDTRTAIESLDTALERLIALEPGQDRGRRDALWATTRALLD